MKSLTVVESIEYETRKMAKEGTTCVRMFHRLFATLGSDEHNLYELKTKSEDKRQL